MAHSTNIISSIRLPNGTEYQIHDAQAIHSVEELGLSAALVFKGTKATEAEVLAITSAKVGDVWLATATNTEYVCVTAISGTAKASSWEKLGGVHDASSSRHTHNVTVTGTNSESTVTASGDNVNALTGVSVAAPAITLTNNSSNVAGSVPVVSAVDIGSASASLTNGKAAAQTWTQNTGTTGTPQ